MALGAGVAAVVPAAAAQTNAALELTDQPRAERGQPAAEKEACIQNLKVISKAIEAYQRDHLDLPNWLSDLVPQYLADANVLICPVCRRTGKIEAPPLADPKLSTSYLFEFCPVPLGGTPTNAPARTRREWKRRQMGLVGSLVPIVRCRHHDPVLNLAFDGRIYESPSLWETLLTNRVNPTELTAARLFARDGRQPTQPSEKPAPAPTFPPRDPKARVALLDLTDFYNASLTQSWHGNAGNDLAALPQGLQTFAGVEFDVRGIVQLGSKSRTAAKFPAQVTGIPVHQKCERLHFLHAAGFGSVDQEGKQIGTYVVHYATNQMRLEIPIYYGRGMRNWHVLAGEPDAPEELKVAWTGQNAVSRRAGGSLRLFITTWPNLAPGVEIESIDFVSSMLVSAPFLLGITVE